MHNKTVITHQHSAETKGLLGFTGLSQQAISQSKLTIETQEQGVKYVQS